MTLKLPFLLPGIQLNRASYPGCVLQRHRSPHYWSLCFSDVEWRAWSLACPGSHSSCRTRTDLQRGLISEPTSWLFWKLKKKKLDKAMTHSIERENEPMQVLAIVIVGTKSAWSSNAQASEQWWEPTPCACLWLSPNESADDECTDVIQRQPHLVGRESASPGRMRCTIFRPELL